MQVSSVTDSRRNLFIKYANHFMSNNGNDAENASKILVSEPESANKPKGIETLTAYSIFPKQVINGKTIITA